MIDIKNNYLATIFIPTIDASPQNISDMMMLFVDKGFVPTTQQELAFSDEAVPVTPQLRFNLNSPKNEWVIHFGSGRIDISKNQTDAKGSNIGNIEQFSKDASGFFSRILRKIGQKAHQVIAFASLSHKNEIVQETAIRAFECWGGESSLKILENVSVSSKWVEEYLKGVISDLKSEYAY